MPPRRILPHVLLALAVGLAFQGGAFEPLERVVDDLLFRQATRAPSGEVVVVGIDPRSLGALEVWPWDRGYHATLLENLLGAGATRVGFDVDFSSRAPHPDEDRELAGALTAAGDRVVLPTFHQQDWRSGGAVQTRPLPSFMETTRLASINIRPESDGLVRRYPRTDTFAGGPVPSFAAALAGAEGEGTFEVDFGIDQAAIPRMSYVDVFTGHFDPREVDGKVVIVGPTAVELGDQVAVPRWTSIPGPLLQALAFESLVQDRALRRPSAATTLLALVLLCAGAVLLFRRLPVGWGVSVLLGYGAALVALALGVQWHLPLSLDVVPLFVGPALMFGAGALQRFDQQRLSLLLQTLHLRRTESLMQHVVDNSLDAILTLEADGAIVDCNAAAFEMFGAAEEMNGRPIKTLLPGWHRRPSDGRQQYWESTALRLDGSTLPVELSVVAVRGDADGRMVCFIRDISERKNQERALTHQANHDALTGLPNRFLLMDRLDQALQAAERRCSPVAFMILDLDRFKEVNDTLGHHVGDLLLKQIGLRLTTPLRKSDTIARLGGDEFAVLLPEATLADAREIAERLTQTMIEPFTLYGLSLQIEASVGVAMYPVHGNDSAELIQRADVAMYVAKRAGSELAVYNPDQDFTSLRHLTLNGELRKAIEADDLSLHYQPKIACDDGRITGVEALVRWRHPEHGLLPPAEFIGVAEHTGLIKPLSHWVLRTAIGQCAEWSARGHDLTVAVNLSARNLQEEDLPGLLAGMLQEAGLPAPHLTLEITESVLMDNPDRAAEVLTEFAKLGVNVSIDDFGTGYSSLAYLKRLPATEIKIDRAFVRNVADDKDDQVIVRSTIDMAHNLGLRVVAEGVENHEAFAHLRELCCDSAQGYLFSPPVPASALDGLLEDGLARRAAGA